MAEKPLTLTRWWYLPPLLTLVISGADSFFFALLPKWLFITLLIVCFLLLLLQIALFFSALIQRQWWRALGILVGSFISIMLLCLNLLVLMVSAGMDNAHSSRGPASFICEEDSISCTIRAEIPDSALSQAVGEWMDEQLGGYYTGNVTDMQGLVDFYGSALCDSLRPSLAEGYAEQVEYEAEMVKSYETPQFVTYSLSTYLDLGGAHPVSTDRGATFRKSDGRRLSWDIIRNGMSSELNNLLVQTLCDYCGVDDETELEGMLMDKDVSALPLPKTPPYFVENGVVVVYQQYEIAAYALGMPGDTISYDRFSPLMTGWAQELISE